MGVLEDVIKALERVPGWKRIAATPAEVDALRARVEALEARLAPATGDICPKCRAPAFHIVSNRPNPQFEWAGKSLDTWRCDKCDYTVEEPHVPAGTGSKGK